MPRPLVFGNGTMLLAYDSKFRLRELFWPQIGGPNHMAGLSAKMGVWVDGEFSWLDGNDWEISMTYGDFSPKPSPFAGKVEASALAEAVVQEGLSAHVTKIEIFSTPKEVEVRFQTNDKHTRGLAIPRDLFEGVIATLKTASGMDPEAKSPLQEGHFEFQHAGRNVLLQTSCEETRTGEKFTIRVVDSSIVQSAETRLSNIPLGLFIKSISTLDATEPHLSVTTEVHDLENRERDVRLFFTQHLQINESTISDGVLFHPEAEALIHYKGNHAFLFASKGPSGKLDQFSCGGRHDGAEGSWKDAEDGHLNGKAISLGNVDSAYAIHFNLEPLGKATVKTTLLAGSSVDDVALAYVGNPRVRLQEVPWLATLKTKLAPLPKDIASFAEKSALILKTQIDSGGGILAANDSDIMRGNRVNYSHVWPRDGALVAQVLDAMGDHEAASRYFEWCRPLITERRPFFLQKYNADGTFACSWHPWNVELPIQEDETALTVIALCEHIAAAPGADLSNWAQMLTWMCDFLVEYVEIGFALPRPSYDLWEERRGIHAFTVASVIGALKAAAQLLNRPDYAAKAEEMCGELLERFVSKEEGLARTLVEQGPVLHPDTTSDASLYWVGRLAGISPDHEAIKATEKKLEKDLLIPSHIGGVARYSGDWYWREGHEYAGNPWPICTLWRAQGALARGETEPAIEALRWCMSRAETTGVLAEQFDPTSGAPLSVSPLTWSHAEVVRTAIELAARLTQVK